MVSPIYYQFKLLLIPPYDMLEPLINRCIGMYWYRWQSDCLLEVVVSNHSHIPDFLFSQAESWEVVDWKKKPRPYGIKDITKYWFSSQIKPEAMAEAWVMANSMIATFNEGAFGIEGIVTFGFVDQERAKLLRDLFVGQPHLTDVFEKPIMGPKTENAE